MAKGVEAIVVPGSAMTRIKAEAEGLRAIFEAAGFEWRPEAGCSMCLAMNDDIAMDGERVASSTNRNFEGRQGRGARTHLMSPAMVAAAAVTGHLALMCEISNERQADDKNNQRDRGPIAAGQCRYRCDHAQAVFDHDHPRRVGRWARLPTCALTALRAISAPTSS